jgi:hypothetical protein
MAFLLPAAWDYADYARSLRIALPSAFREFHVHRSSEPLFQSVRDGCVIVVGIGYREPHLSSTRIEHASAVHLEQSLGQTGRPIQPVRTGAAGGTVQLGEVADIRLGGVTGDANYFLFSDQKRSTLGIPTRACTPVLSRASHLIAGAIGRREWERLREAGERVWLFRPNKAVLADPAVQAYMRLDREDGGCNRSAYKVLSRSVWYTTPLPARVDGFISGMGIQGPWISLRLMRGLTATNTLYVLSFKQRLSLDTRAAWASAFLSPEVREELRGLGRVYPDGLVKYEPGDLLRVRLPYPCFRSGAMQRYKALVASFLVGSKSPAET